jgi:hypothetical protein
MLYFVFTVDGDWEEYFNLSLSEENRKPKAEKLLPLIDREIGLAQKLLSGRFIHFVHSSPRARDFFLKPEFIARWEKIEELGGSIGVHCHEDDPQKAYYFDDRDRMDEAITFLSNGLKKAGLLPISYRGGYMSFSSKVIPALEVNDIHLDFSCDPGRHMIHQGRLPVSDWRGAPDNFYRMDLSDHRKVGGSGVYEIPLGSSNGGRLYFETNSLFRIWRTAKGLAKRAKKEDVVVSVLAHSYDFSNPMVMFKIKMGLKLLRKYGKFINAQEALEVVRRA